MNTSSSPTFVIRGSKSKDYKRFIEDLGPKWGRVVRHKVRTLPNVSGDRVFHMYLEGDHGKLSVFLRQKDVYYVAWGKELTEEELEHNKRNKGKGSKRKKEQKFRLYVLSDSHKEFMKFYNKKDNVSSEPFLEELVHAEVQKMDSTYHSLRGNAPKISKIRIGRDALLEAVNYLSQMNEVKDSKEHQRKIAKACLVMTQMFSESLRFDNVFQLVTEGYDGEGYITDELELMEKDWGTLSKKLKVFWNNPEKLTPEEKEQCKNLRLVKFTSIQDFDTNKKK